MALILRSGESDYWDYPREVTVVNVYVDADTRVDTATLNIDDPALTGHFAVQRRDRGAWAIPPEGQSFPLAMWTFRDVFAVIRGGEFHRPSSNPDAWCDIEVKDFDTAVAEFNARMHG